MILLTFIHFCLLGLLFWFCAYISSVFASFYVFTASTLLTISVAYYLLPVSKLWFYDKRISPNNKSVLITGCDSGFGHLLAKRLKAEGFTVFASCLFPDGPGAQSLKQIGSKRLHVLPIDVTNDESVAEAVDYVKKHLNNSELWALVNNAGIYQGYEAAWTPLKCYENCFQVNALGVVRVTKAFIPLLRKSKGRVVTLTSITGRISFPHLSAYEMSKFAAICFCECLRQELHPWGIKVISIEPELFKTSLCDARGIERNLVETIENLDEDTRKAYGEDYFKRYQKYTVCNMAKLPSPKLHKVLESLTSAVCLSEPCDVYKPCRNKFGRWIVWVMEVLPKPVLDLSFRLHNYTSRFPLPQVPCKEDNTQQARI